MDRTERLSMTAAGILLATMVVVAGDRNWAKSPIRDGHEARESAIRDDSLLPPVDDDIHEVISAFRQDRQESSRIDEHLAATRVPGMLLHKRLGDDGTIAVAWLGGLALDVSLLDHAGRTVSLLVNASVPGRISWTGANQESDAYGVSMAVVNNRLVLDIGVPERGYRVFESIGADGVATYDDSVSIASCVCRALPPKGSCSTTRCDDKESCQGGPGGQNCAWVVPHPAQ